MGMFKLYNHFKNGRIFLSLPLMLALSINGACQHAEACAGSGFWPREVQLTSQEHFGLPTGFMISFLGTDGGETQTLTIYELMDLNVKVTVTPTSGDGEGLTGTLSTPEHSTSYGYLLWTPDEGPLAVGDYIVTVYSEDDGDRRAQRGTLQVGAPEPLNTNVVSLSSLRVQEVQSGVERACCDSPDYLDCISEYGGWCGGSPQDDCNQVCWTSGLEYSFEADVALNWTASPAMRSMTYIQVLHTLGERSVPDQARELSFKLYLREGEPLPDLFCVRLALTHMVTGQQVETGETCVSERDYTRIPHRPLTRDDYNEEELDRWLTCNSLTEHQRLILTSAGKLGSTGDVTNGGAEDLTDTPELGSTGDVTNGGAEDLTDTTDQDVHDQGGCQQAQPRISLLFFLLGLVALVKKRWPELH